jgi:hypothetical protein
MSGWNTIKLIRHLEQEIDKLGFKFAGPKHGDWQEECNSVSLVPKDESALPIYTRNVELFKGSIEELRVWIHGVRWAREYDMMLRLGDDKKRSRAEEKERARQALQALKEEQKKVWEILEEKEDPQVEDA